MKRGVTRNNSIQKIGVAPPGDIFSRIKKDVWISPKNESGNNKQNCSKYHLPILPLQRGSCIITMNTKDV